MAADGHIGQHSQKIIFQKNYCNTCFPSNFGSLISFLTVFFYSWDMFDSKIGIRNELIVPKLGGKHVLQ